MSETPLARWLRAAYGDGEAAGACPPPEAFLEAAEGRLAPREQERLAEHARSCPACAAEQELARAFAAGEEGMANEDIDFVVARLEAESPFRSAASAPEAEPRGTVAAFPTPGRSPRQDAPRAGRVLPMPARREAPAGWGHRFTAPLRLAAAAILAVAVGLLVQRWGGAPPSLPPPPPAGSAVRGAAIETLSPAGEVAELPAELRWRPLPGARSYRVRLRAVDDAVLWEATLAAPPARLPAAVAADLHRAVVYTWSVEALGPDNRRTAASEAVQFRVRPLPDPEERGPGGNRGGNSSAPLPGSL